MTGFRCESELSEWNASVMGPKKIFFGELKKPQRSKAHFCTSSHRAEHWFFMGHGKDFDSDIKEPLAKATLLASDARARP